MILMLLDRSAAFDIIDHKLLLDRLEEWFDIPGDALRWIGSYLSAISIQGKLSIPMSLIYGVPQDFLFSGSYFLYYIQHL